MTRLEDEPPGWRELCAKLRTAKDPDEFQAVIDQINRLLTAHEKAQAGSARTEAPRKQVGKAGKEMKERR